MRLLPFSIRMRSAHPRSRSDAAGGVEQGVFLQPAAVKGAAPAAIAALRARLADSKLSLISRSIVAGIAIRGEL